MLEISKEEWEIAHRYLDHAPEGTKLPYSAILDQTNQLIPRLKRLNLFNDYQTTHSFIKFKGKIYGLAQGKTKEAVIGSGSFGLAKFIKEEEGNISLVKIENQEELISEEKILIDLNLSVGKVKRADKNKYYTQITYLGKTLADIIGEHKGYSIQLSYKIPKADEIKPNKLYLYLHKGKLKCKFTDKQGLVNRNELNEATIGINLFNNLKTALQTKGQVLDKSQEDALFAALAPDNVTPLNDLLNDEQRLSIAIDLCLQVHRLHQGLASKTNTAYAHLDIKPGNITIDKDGYCHLIDFGFTEKFPTNIRQTREEGTALYLPYQPNGLTKQQYDVLALKRTLFMPRQFYCDQGHVELTEDEIQLRSVLSSQILKDYQLDQYINTTSTYNEKKDFGNDDINPVTLAALLIAAKLRLKINLENIRKNIDLSLAITALYTNEESVENINKILQDTKKIELMAAFSAMNSYPMMNEFMKDELFSAAILKAGSHAAACVLIYLKANKLNDLYQSTLASPETVNAIFLLIQQRVKTDVQKVIENTSIVKTINQLGRCNLGLHLQKIIDSPNLCDVIVRNENNETFLNALLVILNKEGPMEDILAIADNNRLALAITILNQVAPNLTNEKVIKNKELAEAIIYCNSCNIIKKFSYSLLLMVPAEAWRAINAISQSDCTNKKALIEKIISNDDYADRICYLEQKKLPQFYSQAITDYIFSISIRRLAELGTATDGITADLLNNDDFIQAISFSYLDLDRLQTILILFNNNLFSHENLRQVENNSSLKRLLTELNKQNLPNHLKILLAYPNTSRRIISFMETEGALAATVLQSEQLFKVLVEHLDEGTEAAKAYLFLEMAKIELQSKSLNDDEINAINLLGKKEEIDVTIYQKIITEASFAKTLAQTKELFQSNAVIKAAQLGLDSQQLEFIAAAKSPALGQLLDFSSNTEQGLLYLQLYQSIKDLKAHKKEATERLINNINNLINTSFSTPNQSSNQAEIFTNFHQEFIKTVNEERKELESHQGIMGIVDTILTVLASLLILYPLVYLYQQNNDIRYSFFKPQSAQLLHNVENKLNQIEKEYQI